MVIVIFELPGAVHATREFYGFGRNSQNRNIHSSAAYSNGDGASSFKL